MEKFSVPLNIKRNENMTCNENSFYSEIKYNIDEIITMELKYNISNYIYTFVQVEYLM